MPVGGTGDQPEREDRLSRRANPRQVRSRDRQLKLMDEAEQLIAQVGIEGLAMREVARRAGLPIASAYHYYPSTSAIVRAIALRQLERVGFVVRERLAQLHGGATTDLSQFAADMIADLADFLGTMPAAPAIWSAARSNPELRALDRSETIEVATSLVPIIADVSDEHSIDGECLMIVIMESVAVNLMFMMECDEQRRSAHLRALQYVISSALSPKR